MSDDRPRCALAAEIEELYERATSDLGDEAAGTVEEAMALLDDGSVRVAAPTDTGWRVNEWAKKAILLSFRTRGDGDDRARAVRVPRQDAAEGRLGRARRARRAARRPSARAPTWRPGVVLMPSYVNVGAWVGSGTMVDTWATVGSCAQIGTDVHLSGGVGIGGVLEPLQASPVIVEDGAFVGSRCIVVEGVRVGPRGGPRRQRRAHRLDADHRRARRGARRAARRGAAAGDRHPRHAQEDASRPAPIASRARSSSASAARRPTARPH